MFVIGDTMMGVAWGFMVGTIPMWLLLLVGIWVSLVAREHPNCRCGRWKSGDYESLDYSLDPPMYFDYRCIGCGRRYRHRNGICYDIDDQNIERPYMTQKGLLPWRPASSA
jgi:hypothetical protein